MNGENPLANLRDIHLPEQISWWPLAPGWWIVIALVVTLLVWLGYKLWQRHQFRQTYRLCQSEIAQLEVSYKEHQDARQLLSGYSQLLRRLLMLRLGRSGNANLHGDNLFALLEANGLGDELSAEYKSLLTEGPYRKSVEIDDHESLKNNLDKLLLKLSLIKPGKSAHA